MRYKVIAIEREYASGGREIGEKLAQRLGLPCYGQEIIVKAAEKLGVSPGELSALEESVSGSLRYSLSILADISSGRNADLPRSEKLALMETDIVRQFAAEPCVIIGRSAAGLLRDNEKAFKVFIYADREARMARAINTYQIAPKQAPVVMQQYDKRRSNYYRYAVGVDWKDAATYHLFLNSAKLGIDRTVDVLYDAVK